jgi:hypothetical protein
MFKWENIFSIFKFEWLLKFEQCNIVTINGFNMDRFVHVESEELSILSFGLDFC